MALDSLALVHHPRSDPARRQVSVVQIFRGKGIQPYYLRLVADNGQVLSISEGYLTRWNARRAAKKNFPGLSIREVAQ